MDELITDHQIGLAENLLKLRLVRVHAQLAVKIAQLHGLSDVVQCAPGHLVVHVVERQALGLHAGHHMGDRDARTLHRLHQQVWQLVEHPRHQQHAQPPVRLRTGGEPLPCTLDLRRKDAVHIDVQLQRLRNLTIKLQYAVQTRIAGEAVDVHERRAEALVQRLRPAHAPRNVQLGCGRADDLRRRAVGQTVQQPQLHLPQHAVHALQQRAPAVAPGIAFHVDRSGQRFLRLHQLLSQRQHRLGEAAALVVRRCRRAGLAPALEHVLSPGAHDRLVDVRKHLGFHRQHRTARLRAQLACEARQVALHHVAGYRGNQDHAARLLFRNDAPRQRHQPVLAAGHHVGLGQVAGFDIVRGQVAPPGEIAIVVRATLRPVENDRRVADLGKRRQIACYLAVHALHVVHCGHVNAHQHPVALVLVEIIQRIALPFCPSAASSLHATEQPEMFPV